MNDTFGHQIGDRVLERVGGLLTATVRASDPVARYGGEEFVVIMPDADLLTAVQLTDRLRERIEHDRWTELADALKVTVSAGVATGPMRSIRDVFEQADTALLQAKRAGRNRVMTA